MLCFKNDDLAAAANCFKTTLVSLLFLRAVCPDDWSTAKEIPKPPSRFLISLNAVWSLALRAAFIVYVHTPVHLFHTFQF